MTDSTVKTETITDFSGYTLKTNRRGTKYYTDVADNIVAKQCIKCKEIKEVVKYNKDKSKFGGRGNICKQCFKKYYSENKEQIAESQRKYRAENKEQVEAIIKNWQQANPEKLALYNQRRRARKTALPDTLTPLDLQLFDSVGCYLLPESESLHLEHFIPVSWGIGGTTFENCYYMDGSLNISKGNRNPFDWIETQSAEIQDNFYSRLVPELSARNGMTVEQFTLYVYECGEQFLAETSEAVTV